MIANGSLRRAIVYASLTSISVSKSSGLIVTANNYADRWIVRPRWPSRITERCIYKKVGPVGWTGP